MQWLRSWAPNSRVGGSNPTWALLLCKSLYPNCSSVPSSKIGTWLQLRRAKWAKTSVPLTVPEPGEVQVGLRVPTPHQWYCQCFLPVLAQLQEKIPAKCNGLKASAYSAQRVLVHID